MLRIFAVVGVERVALVNVGTGAAQKAAEPTHSFDEPKETPID